MVESYNRIVIYRMRDTLNFGRMSEGIDWALEERKCKGMKKVSYSYKFIEEDVSKFLEISVNCKALEAAE
jgi:hypothetical protein